MRERSGKERDEARLAFPVGTDEGAELIDGSQQCCQHAQGGGTDASGARFSLSVFRAVGDGYVAPNGLIGACGYRGPQPGLKRQHAVVAVAMDAWRRNRQTQPVA